jgi:hypothetical protein
MKYFAIAKNGGLTMNLHTKKHFKDFLKKNDGMRLEITPLLPESKKQRAFFEGAVVPLACYLSDNLDHRKWEDCKKMRESLKIEFNGELVPLMDKVVKIAKTTKGKLNLGFIDDVIDWLEENYGIDRIELLNPDDYKYWRDVIFPHGDDENTPDNYIDYLIQKGKLKKVEDRILK